MMIVERFNADGIPCGRCKFAAASDRLPQCENPCALSCGHANLCFCTEHAHEFRPQFRPQDLPPRVRARLPTIITSRKHFLALDGWPLNATVTVEIASKWYGIWLVEPLDPASEMYRLTELDFGVLEAHRESRSGRYFVDHCPHPIAVKNYAEANGYELDEIGFELMVGRWETEVVQEEYER